MSEPVVTVLRFHQAVDRLEVLRGIPNAAQKLFVRMTTRFKAWNLRHQGFNYRFTDRGPAQ